jgi:hypothetical protein
LFLRTIDLNAPSSSGTSVFVPVISMEFWLYSLLPLILIPLLHSYILYFFLVSANRRKEFSLNRFNNILRREPTQWKKTRALYNRILKYDPSMIRLKAKMRIPMANDHAPVTFAYGPRPCPIRLNRYAATNKKTAPNKINWLPLFLSASFTFCHLRCLASSHWVVFLKRLFVASR